jgi:hypothetical protein
MAMSITKAIRASRRAAAELRQAAYDKLSLEEKLSRLPKNGESNRERARLEQALLDKKANVQEAPKVEVSSKPEEKVKKPYQKKSKS